jgi:hypothetical protein
LATFEEKDTAGTAGAVGLEEADEDAEAEGFPPSARGAADFPLESDEQPAANSATAIRPASAAV